MEVTRVTATQRPLTIHNGVGVVLLILGIFLLPVAGVAYVGGNYAHNYVSNELKSQRIVFPQDMSDEPRALRPFAGQTVDTGPEAKAFATMVKGHVAKVTNGRTFSEISKAARQDSGDQALQRARATALEGNMIYGTLQNAYGWWLMGTIALWAALISAVVGLLLAVIGVVLIRRKRTIT